VGRKPDRRQQVDIVYNFIGHFDPPMTAEEINRATQKAEQDTEKKVKYRTEQQRRRNAAFQAKEKAARRAANNGHKFSQRTCDQCGAAYWPASNTQRFCTPDCAKAHQRHLRTQERQTQREGHTFRQKTCRLCGTPFWPVNGQQELCSEACRKLNRNRRQLEYYYRKKEENKEER
jgi:predicted nucleic acid-binding Zn ribbon protein